MTHLMIEEARAVHCRAVANTTFRAECGLSDDDLTDPEQFDWTGLHRLLFTEDDLLSLYGGVALSSAGEPSPSLTTSAKGWSSHYAFLPVPPDVQPAEIQEGAEAPTLLSAVEGDPWVALNEREQDRPRGPRAGLLSPVGAMLWAGVAEELSSCAYHQALEWTDARTSRWCRTTRTPRTSSSCGCRAAPSGRIRRSGFRWPARSPTWPPTSAPERCRCPVPTARTWRC